MTSRRSRATIIIISKPKYIKRVEKWKAGSNYPPVFPVDCRDRMNMVDRPLQGVLGELSV